MIEFIKEPWPWYVAGPLIGLFVPLLLIGGNKIFGVSSSLRHICAMCVPMPKPVCAAYLVISKLVSFVIRWTMGPVSASRSALIRNKAVRGLILPAPRPSSRAITTRLVRFAWRRCFMYFAVCYIWNLFQEFRGFHRGAQSKKQPQERG